MKRLQPRARFQAPKQLNPKMPFLASCESVISQSDASSIGNEAALAHSNIVMSQTLVQNGELSNRVYQTAL